jgi:hypothetical protein
LTLISSGFVPSEFKWSTFGQSSRASNLQPDSNGKRKRSNAGLLGPKFSPKKKQNLEMSPPPPPSKPIIDPSLPQIERNKIINDTRERLVRAQQLYNSLSNMIRTKSAADDIKSDIAKSKAVRYELQTELGDKLFDGLDLSIKRENSGSKSSGGDGAGSDSGARVGTKKRKPKRTYN